MMRAAKGDDDDDYATGPRTLLTKVKQQTADFIANLKSGWADLFWKSRPKRRLIRRASRAVV
jgi:hypothetical protein